MAKMSNKEQQCIELSCAAKIASAQSALADLQENGLPFESPLLGINRTENTSVFNSNSSVIHAMLRRHRLSKR
jgi:hypothetical protein